MRRSQRPTDMSRSFRAIASVVIAVVRMLRWRITTTGLEHVPRSGGAVVTWNHSGHVDVVSCVWDVVRVLRRQPHVLAKSELWRSPWTRWMVEAVGAVPVDRDSDTGRARSLASAVETLQAGKLVALAPEGTISPSFELLPFRTGAARMAQQAQVPIVPAVSWGTHRMVTSGHGFSLRRGYRIPVSVRFGEPIHVGPDDDVQAATQRLRDVTQRLLRTVQEEYPGGNPPGAWWVPARLGGGAPRHEPSR